MECFPQQLARNVPRTLYTDRGSVFTSSRCQLFGIEHRVSPAYHPQTNGMVELWHRTLKEVLKTMSSMEDWTLKLPLLLLGLRARPIADAGLSSLVLIWNLPGDFISLDSKELDGVQFYQRLKFTRNGYTTKTGRTRNRSARSSRKPNMSWLG